MSEKKSKQPILVPVDFSLASQTALLKAGGWAQCLKLPIVILHVVHDPGDMPGYYSGIADETFLLRIEDNAKKMLDTFVDSIIAENPEFKSIKKATRKLVVGIPATRIVEVSEQLDPAMVVMRIVQCFCVHLFATVFPITIRFDWTSDNMYCYHSYAQHCNSNLTISTVYNK